MLISALSKNRTYNKFSSEYFGKKGEKIWWHYSKMLIFLVMCTELWCIWIVVLSRPNFTSICGKCQECTVYTPPVPWMYRQENNVSRRYHTYLLHIKYYNGARNRVVVSGLGIRSFTLGSFAQNRSLQKSNSSDVSDSIVICSFALKNEWFNWKIRIFHHFFDSFSLLSPFYAQDQIAPLALWLFSKSNSEQIVPVALYKRAIVRDSLFSMSEFLFCSFAHKKRAICSKSQTANFQPWVVSLKSWLHFPWLSY